MLKSKANQKYKTGWRCWHTLNPSTQEAKAEVSLLSSRMVYTVSSRLAKAT